MVRFILYIYSYRRSIHCRKEEITSTVSIMLQLHSLEMLCWERVNPTNKQSNIANKKELMDRGVETLEVKTQSNIVSSSWVRLYPAKINHFLIIFLEQPALCGS